MSLDGPVGIALDRDDNIIICDTSHHKVKIYSKDGNLIKTFGGTGCSHLPGNQTCF